MQPTLFSFLAFSPREWAMDNIVTLAATAIVLIGLGIWGIPDLLRFSVKRIWAIADVCYQESIRRKVLWIIPLAILGLVIVVLLQRPMDEQDAIRESTKFCIFATGLVVVTSTIILACTNLPREIENRVIFTVVTKPTTRLEIVLGKITGFARVSATILVIMVLVSYIGLSVQGWSLRRDMKDRLTQNTVEPISRPTIQHYVDAGLLNAQRMAIPDTINILGKMPEPGSHRRYPTPDGYILIPFRMPQDILAAADNDGSKFPGLSDVQLNIRAGFDPVDPKMITGSHAMHGPPRVGVAVRDQNANNVLVTELKGTPAIIPSADGSQWVTVTIPANYATLLLKLPLIYLAVASAGGDGNMWLDVDPAHPPVTITTLNTDAKPITILPSDPADPSKPGRYIFVGQLGQIGQQLKGDPASSSQVCEFNFNGVKIDHRPGDTIPIELRVGVEKSGETRDEDVPTIATFTVINSTTGKETAPFIFAPENNRPFYASIPASAVEGGKFKVVIRCLSGDQWLNLRQNSLQIVQSEDSFAWNLTKSALILWLLSILVTTIAIFCSTFLSWPIAVVLTLVILLGRWGVNQLGDTATAGIGRQVAQDFGMKDLGAIQVVSGTVEELNKGLKAFAVVLPDIERFSATSDIDHGISIPLVRLANSIIVLLVFGLPLTVLAYVFLKNKEVAP